MMKFRSLRTKILLTMTLALVASLLVSGVISVRIQRNQLIQHHLEYQRGILQLVMNGIILSMKRNEPDEIRETLSGFQQHSEIRAIRIISPEGVIRYSTNAGECGNTFPQPDLAAGEEISPLDYIEEFEDRDQHLLTMTRRIENQPDCQKCHGSEKKTLGFLSIENDISSIDRDIAVNSRNNILMALGTLALIASLIAVVHLRFVQRSLHKVLNAISEVERGNFQTHIDVPKSDEMGRLAASFNHMIDRLNQTRKELKRMHQQQLERADKLASVGELAAGMAHEIKNPIIGISSALKIILDEGDPDDVRRPIFEEIARQIHRVDRAVNSLLSYARPQAPKFTSTDIADIITRSLKLARQQAEAAKIEIERGGDAELPEIIADPVQLEQVIVNLMMNGIQAMPKGGKLTVEQFNDTASGMVKIRIRDTGVGIEEDKLEQIFRPFYTTKHRGTGLGLAICQDIIHRHGGKIEVESKPGEGSVFTVILPFTS